MQQPLPLVLGEAGDGDAGPAGHHGGDVISGDGAVLGIVFAALVPLDLHLLAVILLDVPQLGGLLIVLGGDSGILVLDQGGDLLLQALELGRDLLRLHPHPAGGLVHQVDGLVGQETVVDIPGGQGYGGLQGLVGDLELVVLLIALPQALEDLQTGLLAGLAHLDRLEPALQGGVLFDILAVLIERGGADHLDLAPAQGRLDDVGGVHSALGAAGAHDGVELVDEKDHVAGLLDLLQHLLDPLLKLAPVLGTGHHAAQVQRQQALIQQVVRHVAQDDLPGQPLGDGGLAHAGLADQAGVVLGPAGEDLDDPLDLIVTADDRVQLAGAGVRGQVPGELPQSLGLGGVLLGRGALGLGGPAPGRLIELLHQGGVEVPGVHAGGAQDADGHVVALPQDAGQQVLGAHVVVAAPHGVLHSDLHHPLGPGGQALGRVAAGQPRAHALFQDLHDHLVGEARLGQDGVGHALALPDQAQQQVLGAHVPVAQIPSRLLGKPQSLLGPGREFVLIHMSLPSFPWESPYSLFSLDSLRSASRALIWSRISAARSKFS